MSLADDIAMIRESHGPPIETSREGESLDVYLTANFEGASIVVVHEEFLIDGILDYQGIDAMIARLVEIRDDHQRHDQEAKVI